ncbi:MAG: hypothetical protein CM1200mP22_28610 [Dehalococcoidia bacterium]|nr:MAG: hypothetical protein CM1200mP22_28610 [Dehalococcoidia bacterium]
MHLGEERTHRLWTLLRDLLQVILDQNGLRRLRTQSDSIGRRSGPPADMRVHSLFSRLMYLVLLDLKHKDGFDQGTVVTVQKVKLEINVNIVHPLLIITALTS